MTDKDKIRQILGCDSCTDRIKCKFQLQKHNRYYCNIFYVIEGAMKWKEEQIFNALKQLGYDEAVIDVEQLISLDNIEE